VEVEMATRKRRPKNPTPPQQRHAATKIRRPLWILLIVAGIIGLLFAGIGFYSQFYPSQSQQAAEKTVTTPPSETPQLIPPQQSQLVKKTGRNLKSYEQGFLAWEVEETDLSEGRKQVVGTVRWNEKSGAKGEPVRGMPLSLLAIDRAKKELDEIAKGNTDETGRFAFIAASTVETALIGKVEKAANLPAQVVAELKRKERSPEEQRLVQALDTLQQRINTETAWGRKVQGWMAKQHTAFYVDSHVPAPAWYDPDQDRIVVNPEKAMPREQQLVELRKGYLHHFILLFHEELHRAQNRLSGKTKANPEMALLREIHAYWLSHLLSVDDLYRQIYDNPHTHYDKLYRVDRERFVRLCAMMDWLYAYWDADFDQIAAEVGNADSVTAFEQHTQKLIDSTIAKRQVFKERVNQMWQEKQTWKETTARLAQEVLGKRTH